MLCVRQRVLSVGSVHDLFWNSVDKSMVLVEGQTSTTYCLRAQKKMMARKGMGGCRRCKGVKMAL